MTPERKPSAQNINVATPHTGNHEGELNERPLPGARPINDLTNEEGQPDTEKIRKVIPEHSGQLLFTDPEVEPFQEKHAQQRAYHEAATAGYTPSEVAPNAPEKKKGHKTLLAVMGGVAAAATAAVSLYLLPKGESDADANKPVASHPVATAPASPAETADAPAWAFAGKLPDRAKSIDPNVVPKDTVESGLFDQLSADQKANILKMKNMPVEDFRNLPLNEQLLFSQYVYDNNAPHNFQLLENSGFGHADYVNRLKLPAETDTAQQIVDGNQMTYDVSRNLFEGSDTFDLNTARKIAVLSTQPATQEFAAVDNQIVQDRHGLADSSTTSIHGFKRYTVGDTIFAKINVTDADGKDCQNTYKYTPFTDAWGQTRSIWLMESSITPANPQYEQGLQ